MLVGRLLIRGMHQLVSDKPCVNFAPVPEPRRGPTPHDVPASPCFKLPIAFVFVLFGKI